MRQNAYILLNSIQQHQKRAIHQKSQKPRLMWAHYILELENSKEEKEPMVSFLPGEVTPEDITRIAVFSKVLRTARNPFGRNAGRSRYGGKASPWKMLRKGSKETTAEYLDRLGNVNSGVSDGLAKSIKVSTDPKYQKVLGVAHVIFKDGTMGIMPAKSAIMGRDSTNGKIAVVRRYPNAQSAMMQIIPPAETKKTPKSKQTELPDSLKKHFFQSQL